MKRTRDSKQHNERREAFNPTKSRRNASWNTDLQSSEKRLYRVPEAMAVLALSRSALYEQLRSGRLRSVNQGASRRIPAAAIDEYVQLLETESVQGVDR